MVLWGSYRVQGLGFFPKISGMFLGIQRMRMIVFWDLYWGPPILGNWPMLCVS